jgi:glycosyltransferase involved in cell wall biosynthesis
VNLHDFSGHPFQAQLSRNLAARGHEVLHSYSSQYVTGHGLLARREGDAGGLRFAPVTAGQPLVKYSPAGRARFELSYAQAWQRQLDREQFDVVLACNVPLFALARMRHYFAHRRQPWVFWHQDIYSLGIAGEAERRLPPRAARLVSTRAQRIERAQVRSADAVVAIGEPFLAQYRRWGLRTDHVQVIPNWAPLDHLRPGPRENVWADQHGLPGDPVRLLYAGTLGRKHNPLLLLDLLDAVRARGIDALLTVVSEGVGADDLAAAAAGRGDVRVLGYQPAEAFPDVLASADAVIALLEPDAAEFSVPSKVLSYLSVGRPVVALLPGSNPSAADVRAAGGVVADPSPAGARAAAVWLAEVARIPGGFAELGRRARLLAETRFDIDPITTRFEQVLDRACGASRGWRRPAREPLPGRAAGRAWLARSAPG